MEVRLLIHAEQAASGLVWWTESPQVSGFTGTGEHLVDARIRSEMAIRELLAGQGDEDVSFTYELIGPGTSSEGLRVQRTGQATDEPAGAAAAQAGVAVASAA
jgi:hypothetical protein